MGNSSILGASHGPGVRTRTVTDVPESVRTGMGRNLRRASHDLQHPTCHLPGTPTLETNGFQCGAVAAPRRRALPRRCGEHHALSHGLRIRRQPRRTKPQLERGRLVPNHGVLVGRIRWRPLRPRNQRGASKNDLRPARVRGLEPVRKGTV